MLLGLAIMIAVVGAVILAFLGFEKLSPERKSGLVLTFVAGCIVAAVVMLWQPPSIAHTPLASLTLYGLASNLVRWLIVIGFAIPFFLGASMLLQGPSPEERERIRRKRGTPFR